MTRFIHHFITLNSKLNGSFSPIRGCMSKEIYMQKYENAHPLHGNGLQRFWPALCINLRKFKHITG